MSSVVKIGTDSFEENVVNSEVPVLVDFSAAWCGPCKALAPIIDEIARDYDGRLNVFQVDVDENQDLAGRYKIFSVPTLLVFKGGSVADQIVGYVPKQKLEDTIRKHVS